VGYQCNATTAEHEREMTAHFLCWEPTLGLDPSQPDFRERAWAAQRDGVGASAKLLDFVAALLAKYPDATETEDTPWSTAPLSLEITGQFINFPVGWSWYDDALIAFVVETARSHGLHCFDPQSGRFYEASLA
jgi:hypothetical protein